MTRDVECPGCGETLEISTKLDRTKKIRCPECDQRFLPFAKDTDDERPRTRTEKSKKSGTPKWLPFAIGGGVLAFLLIVGVVLVFALGKGRPKASPEIAKAPTSKAIPAPKPDGTGTPARTGGAGSADRSRDQADRTRRSSGAGRSSDTARTGTADLNRFRNLAPVPVPKPRAPALKPPEMMPARVALPALPPIADRPVLVLDPGAHTGFVKAMAFSEDGTRLVTFSEDKTIRVWDLETGLTTKTIYLPNGPGHEGALTAGALSRDGKTIAASGISFGLGKFGMIVYIISAETGEVLRTVTGHKNPVTSLDFSADGKLLASSSYDGTVAITTVTTGKPAGQLVGHTSGVNKVRFHPKDQRLLTGSGDNSARIWTPGCQGVHLRRIEGARCGRELRRLEPGRQIGRHRLRRRHHPHLRRHRQADPHLRKADRPRKGRHTQRPGADRHARTTPRTARKSCTAASATRGTPGC